MARGKRHFDDWIKAYLEMGLRTEAPERFHFWTAVSTLAGGLRRRVWIDQRTFKWHANFYVILIAPPGICKKSVTMDVGMRLLRDVPDVHFASDISTWQRFVEEVANSLNGIHDPTKPLEFTEQCAITLAVSELGNMIKKDEHELINVLTELWDSKDGPFVKSTKTQGDNMIINPCVNMIGCTTPGWMRMNFRSHFGGWGFSSRIIFLYAEKPDREIAYPEEVMEDTWWKERTRLLVQDLSHISELYGAMSLSPDAKDYGRAWYKTHMMRMSALNANPNSNEWLKYYLARKQTNIHKLAMVLALSKRDELVVTRADLEEAVLRCDEVETQLDFIFGMPAGSDRAEANSQVMDAILKVAMQMGGRLREVDIWAFSRKFMEPSQTEGLIRSLLASGLFLKQVEDSVAWYVVAEKPAPAIEAGTPLGGEQPG